MKKGANQTYWGNIAEGIRSSLEGLRLSFRHILQARKSRKPINVTDADYFEQETGIVTLKYPYEAIPVPDNGRYRLHNEMEDCIVCDKCAKVCPVDCIDIEPIKAVGEVGKASDGSSIRLYAAKFDIDMAKCCFCGLCTTVCPTECLTMTKAYDFSEFAVENMNYHFSNLSPEQAEEKRRLLEEFQREKQATKPVAKPRPEVEKPAEASTPAAVEPNTTATETTPTVKRPVFRPGVKKPATTEKLAETPTEEKMETPPVPSVDAAVPPAPEERTEPENKPTVARPVFRPKMKIPPPTVQPVDAKAEEKVEDTAVPTAEAVPPPAASEESAEPKPAAKRPVYRPKMTKPATMEPSSEAKAEEKPADVPVAATPPAVSEESNETEAEPKSVAKRPVYRPKMKKPDTE